MANGRRGGGRNSLSKKYLSRLFRLQHGLCCLCGKPMQHSTTATYHRLRATIDHAVPLSKGGCNLIYNLLLSHSKCNSTRGNAIIPFKITHMLFAKGRVMKEEAYEN